MRAGPTPAHAPMVRPSTYAVLRSIKWKLRPLKWGFKSWRTWMAVVHQIVVLNLQASEVLQAACARQRPNSSRAAWKQVCLMGPSCSPTQTHVQLRLHGQDVLLQCGACTSAYTLRKTFSFKLYNRGACLQWAELAHASMAGSKMSAPPQSGASDRGCHAPLPSSDTRARGFEVRRMPQAASTSAVPPPPHVQRTSASAHQHTGNGLGSDAGSGSLKGSAASTERTDNALPRWRPEVARAHLSLCSNADA